MKEGERLPIDPTDPRLLIHALADGELDAAATLALERRIANDADLAAEHARITALKTAIGRLPRAEISDALWARLVMLGAGEKAAAKQPRPRFRPIDWRAMAASILVTAFLASGATYWATSTGIQDGLAGAIASGHRRSLLAASPVDIASADLHTVKPWLDARIGVSPPAVDFSKDGFSLVGGRVEVIGDKTMPALVYRHRQHLITLLAAPLEANAAAVPVAVDGSAGGFSLVHWTDGAFSYWAISDTERAALHEFVALFRSAAAAG